MVLEHIVIGIQPEQEVELRETILQLKGSGALLLALFTDD
jgi:hypothetical protein